MAHPLLAPPLSFPFSLPFLCSHRQLPVTPTVMMQASCLSTVHCSGSVEAVAPAGAPRSPQCLPFAVSKDSHCTHSRIHSFTPLYPFYLRTVIRVRHPMNSFFTNSRPIYMCCGSSFEEHCNPLGYGCKRIQQLHRKGDLVCINFLFT
jgi:hypothetical protein